MADRIAKPPGTRGARASAAKPRRGPSRVAVERELAEAREQQAATAEILDVISRSPTDVQPVFEAILERALRLCNAYMGHIGLFDGRYYRQVAQRGASA